MFSLDPGAEPGLFFRGKHKKKKKKKKKNSSITIKIHTERIREG